MLVHELIQENPGILTEVREHPKCSKGFIKGQKRSKLDHLKILRKGHHFKELIIIFPITQMSIKINYVCKLYGWSKFRSTQEKINPEETRGKIRQRHMVGLQVDKW